MSLAIRGILFDKDGTLLDFDATWLPAEDGRTPRRKAKMANNTAGSGRKPKAAPKPRAAPATPFPPASETLHRKGDWLWIPLRQEWRDVAGKPEETVRQHFIRHLCDNYGYTLEQIAQERRTTHGHRSPRADVVIWETPNAKAANRTPVLVIECKAENVDIDIRDYYQGESYTRAAGGEFFIAHNARHTAVFRLIPGVPGEFVQINEIPKAADWGDARRIEEIRKRLRAFNRREFQDLLFRCHSILRDVHKMDPGRAFDTISKILFVKMYVERSGLHGTFTADFLDRRASTRLPSDPLVHDDLFERRLQRQARCALRRLRASDRDEGEQSGREDHGRAVHARGRAHGTRRQGVFDELLQAAGILQEVPPSRLRSFAERPPSSISADAVTDGTQVCRRTGSDRPPAPGFRPPPSRSHGEGSDVRSGFLRLSGHHHLAVDCCLSLVGDDAPSAPPCPLLRGHRRLTIGCSRWPCSSSDRFKQPTPRALDAPGARKREHPQLSGCERRNLRHGEH